MVRSSGDECLGVIQMLPVVVKECIGAGRDEGEAQEEDGSHGENERKLLMVSWSVSRAARQGKVWCSSDCGRGKEMTIEDVMP